MKKNIFITILTISTAISGLAQGWMLDVGGKFSTWDNFTTSGSTAVGSGSIDVALLIGAGNTSITGFTSQNVTNNTTALAATTWGLLLNNSQGFSVVSNGVSVVEVAANTGGTKAAGWGYNGGSSFSLAGNTPAGTYTIYAIAWNNLGGTVNDPFTAAADQLALGWSNPFQYSLAAASNGSLPASLNAAGMLNFGITPIAAVPEPTTIALASLGGLSLLAFRRRNKA